MSYYLSDNILSGETWKNADLILKDSDTVWVWGTLSGRVAVSGTLNIGSGGIVNSAYVISRGVSPAHGVFVLSGGSAINTEITYGGGMYVSSGGIIKNTSVGGWGLLELNSGSLLSGKLQGNYINDSIISAYS